MKEFTLEFYEKLLIAFKKQYLNIITFDEFFSKNFIYENYLILRHDVDRKPQNALKMARLENKYNIKASYYFRTKPHTFKKDIINEIRLLGHEIGYHYESLTDFKGNYQNAYLDFETNLNKLRELSEVSTISMHGAPFSPFDNRDLWKIKDQKSVLFKKFAILGEIYLDIDYSNILYITDTGRNWENDIANRRDKVSSHVEQSFNSSYQLIEYINNHPHNQFIFQTHPERWTNNRLEWQMQFYKDKLINMLKTLIR